MTSGKRVQRLAVAAAVLSAGAFVAGPASSGAPAERVSSETVSTSASDSARASAGDSARAAGFKCGLRLSFTPRVGKDHKRIRSQARVTCNRKMPKIWTSVRLKQTKAPDKRKKTEAKNVRRNKSVITTFCPREYREYKVIGNATVKLPKSGKKKFLKLHKSGAQSGTCR